MKKKRSSKSLAGKTSLRGTGCLSADQSRRFKSRADGADGADWRELHWVERLKEDMARAEAFFWRQTADRRAVHQQYLKGKTWKNHDFCFGAG
jgi:hypothetical protein